MNFSPLFCWSTAPLTPTALLTRHSITYRYSGPLTGGFTESQHYIVRGQCREAFFRPSNCKRPKPASDRVLTLDLQLVLW